MTTENKKEVTPTPGAVLPESCFLAAREAPAQNIYEAMERIWSKVGYVQKKGKVSGTGMSYSFAKETDFIEAIRPEMLANHVICFQIESSMAERSANVVEGKYGEKMNISSVVKVKIRFMHVPSQTYFDTEAMGEGQDSGDKATPKAETIAQKYALRKTFLIETGDDPDKERPEADIKKYKTAPKAAPAPVAPKAPFEVKLDPELNKKFAEVINGMTSQGVFTIGEIEAFLKSKNLLDAKEEWPFTKDAAKQRIIEKPENFEKALNDAKSK